MKWWQVRTENPAEVAECVPVACSAESHRQAGRECNGEVKSQPPGSGSAECRCRAGGRHPAQAGSRWYH